MALGLLLRETARGTSSFEFPALPPDRAVASALDEEMTGTTHNRSPLFTDRPRTATSYASDEEPTWAFLERVDDEGFDRVRRAMNAWFARYPPTKAADLRGRFESKDDIEFHSAWFELYLHELHRRLSYDVTAEPAMPDTPTRPDFLVARDGAAFFLEATIVGDRRTAGRTRRIARVTAAINRVRSPNFTLDVEIESEGRDAPPMRDVRRRLERWLATRDWQDVRAAQEQGFNYDALPTTTASAGDWSFTFRAWPRPPEDRGANDGRAIHAYPSDGGVFDHAGTLLERLEQKADKYGEPAFPVIIAVRLDRLSADIADIRAALMGPSIGRVNPANPGRTVSTGRHGTGMFRHESGRWRNRHVAGVLFWDLELRPWSVARRAPTLWLHLQPGQPLPPLPWSCVRQDTGAARYDAGSFEPALVPELPEVDRFADPAEWPGELFAALRA